MWRFQLLLVVGGQRKHNDCCTIQYLVSCTVVAYATMLALLLCLCVLQGVYDASKHPGVISKRRREEDVMEEFISTFEGAVKDGKVTCRWCYVAAVGGCGCRCCL